jgi:hypothetical protein
MEYSKETIQQLKAEIKTLSEKQRFFKNQRKTVHLVGERTLPSYEATWKHKANRWDLRQMYIAYGIMRGKTIEQIEPNSAAEWTQETLQSLTEKIATKYGKAVCADKE